MKKKTMVLLTLLLTTAAVAGQVSTVEPPKRCQLCKMDRTKFNYSRMLVEYTDGTVVGVCSVHCAAADVLKNPDKKIRSLKVADYKTKALIDAETAVWVVGGNMKGVMTPVPKWAFADKKEAKDFIKENGGKISSFKKVWNMAKKEQAKT